MKFIVSLLLISNLSFALTLKIGVLAPEGTTWANNLKELAKEIRKATDKKVKLKVYYGGVAGDEPDVLRKIHVGQMHGGIFTGRALGDIYKDVRVVEIPFNFNDNREQAFQTLTKMAPYFNEGFEKNGFQNLGFFEIGLIYLVSTKKLANMDQLKGVKIWTWEGDDVASSLIKSMDLVSVPLALPDVLSSLSTGMINAAYNSPMGVLALQWNTKIKYLIDFPVTYSVGAFLVDNKVWSKVSPEHQKIVKDLSQKYLKKVTDATVKENQEALTALKSMGIEMLSFPKQDIEKGNQINASVTSELLNSKVVSPKAVELLKKHTN